jgi:hypothetical protein
MITPITTPCATLNLQVSLRNAIIRPFMKIVNNQAGEYPYDLLLSKVVQAFDVNSLDTFYSYIIDPNITIDEQSKVSINEGIKVILEIGAKYNLNPSTIINGLKVSAEKKLQDAISSALTSSTEIAEVIETGVSSDVISEVRSDMNEDTTGTHIDYELLPINRIEQMPNASAKSLTTVYANYLPETLFIKSAEVINLLKQLAAKNWMSTSVTSDIIENFDFQTIKDSIYKDLKNIIHTYYRNSADAITSAYDMKKPNPELIDILIFTDIDRIPSNVTKVEHSDTSFLLFKVKDTDQLIVVTSNDNLSKDLDMSAVLASFSKANNAKYALQSDLLITEIADLPADKKPKKINLENVRNNPEDTLLFNAYSAYILSYELDTFIEYEMKVLSSLFKEKFRNSYQDIDKAGAEMETKFVNLVISTVPKILTNANIQDVGKTISHLLQEKKMRSVSTDIGDILSSNIFQIVGENDEKVFHYVDGDESIANIIVNLGNTNVVLSYSNKSGWFIEYPVPGENRTERYTSFVDIKTGDKPMLLSTEANGINIFELLNGVTIDAPSVKMSAANARVITQSINALHNLHSTVNSPILNTFSKSSGHKFLIQQDLGIHATKLSDMPADYDEAGEFLRIMGEGNGEVSVVAKALYYKFFHKGIYKVNDVNPITGLFETTEHKSIYQKWLDSEDPFLFDLLVAVSVQLRSSRVDDKIFLENGANNKTNISSTNDSKAIINGINNAGMEFINSKHVLPGTIIKNKFKITSDAQSVNIKYYAYGHYSTKNSVADPTISLIIEGDTVKIEGGNYGEFIPFSVISQMFKDLKMPFKMLDRELHNATKMVFNEIPGMSTSGAVNLFYSKLILLRLSNTVTSSGELMFKNLGLNPSEDSRYYFMFNNNLNDFKSSLEKALNLVFTRGYSPMVEGPTGDTFTSNVYSNPAKRKKQYIKQIIARNRIPSMMKNSAFIKGPNLMTVNDEFTRLGLKVGANGKGVTDMSPLEVATTLISSFLGQLKQKGGLSLEDTMSDRSTSNQFDVSYAYKEMVPLKNSKLDEVELRNRYFSSQFNSFSALQDTVINKWNAYLQSIGLIQEGFKITTLRELYNFLQVNKLSYKQVLHKSGLTANIFFRKAADKSVTLNYAMVQLSEIFMAPTEIGPYTTDEEKIIYTANKAKKDFFLDMYFNEFKHHLKNVNHKFSPKDRRTLEPYLGDGRSYSDEELNDILTKVFFYNDSIFAQELMVFGMGSVFQYNSKVASIFEGMDLSRYSTEDIIEHIENKVQSMGNPNDINTVESILKSKIPNEDKVKLFQYLDIFGQVSPMQIDRVKRNHANGTSGLSPILANKNKAGVLLGQEEKTLYVEDIEVDVFSMNSSTDLIEAWNGAQTITPSYAYKLNGSLGNRFSNFRSTSTFKTVNASKTEDGTSIFEKLLAFSNQIWDMMIMGTSEHHSLHRVMMQKEKFDAQPGSDYTGLYLLENVKFENDALYDKSFQGQSLLEHIAEVRKHGEYLGKVLVTFTDGKWAMIKSSVLLRQIDGGDIAINTISTINTNKVFIGKEVINSKWDLYNYYGGMKTNLEMLNLNKSEGEKNEFLDEFPFGWVEKKIVEIMSNYRGTEHNYPIRDAEINKVNPLSTNKTGHVNVNPSTILTSKKIDLDSLSVTSVSNEFLNVVLKLEGNYDTTSSASISESEENASVATLTQAVSNLNAGGNTPEPAARVNDALAQLSEIQLRMLSDEIISYESLTDGKMTAQRRFLVDKLTDAFKGIAGGEAALEALGVTNDAASKVSLDLRLLYPKVRSILTAEFTRRGIKMRLPGNKMVLSAVKGMVKLYDFGNSNGLVRSSMSGKENDVNGVIKKELTDPQAIHISTATAPYGALSDSGWVLTKIESLAQLEEDHSSLDYVYKVEEVAGTIEGQDAVLLKYTPVMVQDLFEYGKFDTLATYVTPWGDGGIKNNGSDLQWIKYYRNGKSLYDSDEFLSMYIAGEAPTALDNVEVELVAIAKPKIEETVQTLNELTLSLVGLDKRTKAHKETQAAISALLDAKAESEKELLNSIRNAKLEYFTKAMKSDVPAVPKGLWTRFILELQNSIDESEELEWKAYVAAVTEGIDPQLYLSRLLGDNIMDRAYVSFENAVKSKDIGFTARLIDEFFDFIETYKGKEKTLVTPMKTQLDYSLMNDHWVSKEAEFFTPPVHQGAQLIGYGDALSDIVGTQEQPDLPKMASMAKLSEQQVSILTRFYIHDVGAAKVLQELNDRLNSEKVGDDVKAEITKYLELRRIQQAHMEDYFTEKLNNIELSIEKASDKEKDILKKRAPLLLLNSLANELSNTKISDKNLKMFDSLVDGMLNNTSIIVDNNLYNMLLDIKEALKNKQFNQIIITINNAATDFKTMWAKAAASTFEKSLTFFTARIPSQAMQQTIVGKTKGFIYSTKNNIYSPIELLATGGADFDGDTQNNITWAVGSFGNVIDWSHVDKFGKLDLTDALNEITVKAEKLRVNLMKGGDAKNEQFVKSVIKKVNAYKNSAMENLKAASQNYLLEAIMEVTKSSKNAMAISTSVAMNKLKVLKSYLASFNFNESDIDKFDLKYTEVTDADGTTRKVAMLTPELMKLVEKRNAANPFTPSTKMIFERLNLDGKIGIPAFATGIKTYMTVFGAILSDTDLKMFNSAIDTAMELLQDGEVMDIERKAKNISENNATKYIRFNKIEKPIWRNPRTGLLEEGKDLIYPANSEKLFPKVYGKNEYPLFTTKFAKKAYRALLDASSPEEESAILLQYKDSIDKTADYMLEDQAWQDFAELMSAATDNAKELTLAVIGANNTTNNYLSTMLIMGIPLNSALLMINDPAVKKIIKKHEEEGSLTLVNDKKSSFAQKLKNAVFTNNTTKEMVVDRVTTIFRSKFKDIDEVQLQEKIATEIERQLLLEAAYNPIKQLATISTAVNEFSDLRSILSINTQPPNVDLDVINYLLKLEKIFNIVHGKGKNAVTYTLADFLSDDPAKIETIIKIADEKKLAFNIPFIIYNNKTFYQYIKTIYDSDIMLSEETYTNKIIRGVITKRLLKNRKSYLAPEDLYSIKGVLDNIALSTYYRTRTNKGELEIPSLGYKFDLSKIDGPTGREAFIKLLPEIKNALMLNNPALNNFSILKDLEATKVITDKTTGKVITLFEGVNSRVNSSQNATYTNELTYLKTVSYELYNALLNYSLIVDKGGLGKSSLASLFRFEGYQSYNDHLLYLQQSGIMLKLIEKLDSESLGVAMPSLLVEFSTLAKDAGKINSKIAYRFKKYGATINEEDGEIPEEDTDDSSDSAFDSDAFQEFLEEEEKVSKSVSYMYDVSGMNALKKNPAYNMPDIWKSKTNGLTYHWYGFKLVGGGGTFESYVPVLKTHSDVIGNINIGLEDISHNLANIGYAPGWEINLHNKQVVRLLAYAGNNQYYVLNEDKEVYKVQSDVIKKFNPHVKLDSNAISVVSNTLRPTTAFSVTWDSENNEITNSLNFSDNTLILGNHITEKNGGDNVTPAYRMDVSNISNIKMNEDWSTFLTTGKLKTQLVNYFAAVFTTNKLNELKDTTLTSDEAAEQFVNKTFNNYAAAIGTGNVDSVQYKEIISSMSDFIDDLLAPNNEAKLYAFLRKDNLEKLDIIYKEILNDSDTIHVSITSLEKGITPVVTKVVVDSDTKEKVSTPVTVKLIDDSLNIFTLGEQGVVFSSDLELLNNTEFMDSIKFNEYIDLLNSMGINPKTYMKQMQNILQLLRHKGKVYPTSNYQELNNIANKIKYSVEIDLAHAPESRKTEIKKVSPKLINKLSAFLNKRFSGSNIKMMSLSEAKLKYPHAKLDENDNAIVNVGDKTIVLIEGRVTLDTVLHEMGHLYLAELKEKDLVLYEEIMSKMQNDPSFNEINNKYKEKINYNINDILEEVFVFRLQQVHSDNFATAFMVESLFGEMVASEDGQFGLIEDAIGNIFGGFLGVKDLKVKMTDSIEDILQRVGLDMIFNKNSTLHNMDNNYKSNLKALLKNKGLTEAKAIDILIKKGLIRKNCK